eukprot:NODE_20233_length_807_cov_1.076471.p1 GENE.NODE_20233_length_807_cov_1.076471~~NODE_20233_length_807_cov_1.076471.p1  ORF type:complete len:152 (+),score=7.17 NODE_20233_length_807_cov_1.076471:129-584(+)
MPDPLQHRAGSTPARSSSGTRRRWFSWASAQVASVTQLRRITLEQSTSVANEGSANTGRPAATRERSHPEFHHIDSLTSIPIDLYYNLRKAGEDARNRSLHIMTDDSTRLVLRTETCDDDNGVVSDATNAAAAVPLPGSYTKHHLMESIAL